ncbi:MAG TPA: tetratricopeptide repeat protein, partial [Bacteroidia bacterium]
MKVSVKYILLSLVMACMLSQVAFARSGRIDSLKKVLDHTDLADSVRYHALLDYFEAVRFSDPLASLASAKEARSIAERDGNKRRLAAAYSKLGLIYGDLSRLSQAIENQLTALRIYEDLGDTLQIAGMQLNVAIVYEKQGQYAQSTAWLMKALENFKRKKSRIGEAYVYNNLAIISRHLKHPNEAYDYYIKSLAIKEELHDSASLGNGYLNMGLICEDKEDKKKAMEYYNRALKMYSAIRNIRGFAGVYNNIGTLLINEGKLDAGRDTLLKSLQFAQAVRSKEDEQEAHLNLSHVYELLKDYADALKHYDQYRDCKDSILNENGAKQIAMLQAVYETDKKDREFEALQKDHLIAEGLIWKGRIIVIGIVAGIVLVIVL